MEGSKSQQAPTRHLERSKGTMEGSPLHEALSLAPAVSQAWISVVEPAVSSRPNAAMGLAMRVGWWVVASLSVSAPMRCRGGRR